MSHPIYPFFEQLIRDGGSDLHLLEGQPPKIRRHGEIKPVRDVVLDLSLIHI